MQPPHDPQVELLNTDENGQGPLQSATAIPVRNPRVIKKNRTVIRVFTLFAGFIDLQLPISSLPARVKIFLLFRALPKGGVLGKARGLMHNKKELHRNKKNIGKMSTPRSEFESESSA